ncbi:hypothetical protein KY339_02095, partial [Candidatus Woesearchaeota archaeon]|nr:hypothetical protein [Candidatus Woesearchaeota archaeon]
GIKTIKSELESKKKEIEQIEQKVKHLNELKNKYNILETKLIEKVELNNKVKSDLNSFEEQTAKLKQKIDSIVVEDMTEKPEELEKEIAKQQEKINTVIEDRTKLKERANALKTIITQLKAEIEEHTEQIKALSTKKSELEALDNEISKKPQLMKDINSAEEKLKSLHLKLKGLEVKNELSDRTKYNINKLALCPTCRQPVSEDHKKHVCEKEDSRIADNKQSITSLEQDKKKISQNIENAKKLFDNLAEKEKLGEKLKAEIANLEMLKKKLVEKQKEYSKNDIELINISGKLEKIEGIDVEKLKKELQEKGLLLKKIQEKKHLLQMLDEKTKARNDLEETVRELKTQIGKINTEKIELNKSIGELKDIEASYLKAKQQIDRISADERRAEIDKAAFDQELKSMTRIIELIEKEINEKQAVKEKLDVLGQIHHWFDKYFINLAAVMEKHVMLKVYHEFNDLFRKWFGMLLEDDAISVRLDEGFTPIVEQNGYEVEIENLSGGEKTSLALAYRLALNKVINDVMSSIKTKELIILDEPTDGFSTEQLDKLKDVLDELNIEQTILVSHEAKIEGFVENLIRVNKHEHVSAIE